MAFHISSETANPILKPVTILIMDTVEGSFGLLWLLASLGTPQVTKLAMLEIFYALGFCRRTLG